MLLQEARTWNQAVTEKRWGLQKQKMAEGGQAEVPGFSVAPSPNCPHVAASSFQIYPDLVVSDTGALGKAPRKNLYSENCACNTCGDAEESWVCLLCGFSGCSRYKACHMVDHVKDKSNEHSGTVIAISLADLSTWCFACDDYITHPKLEIVFREFHRGKFGAFPTKSLHTTGTEPQGMVLIVEEKTPDGPEPASDASNK